MGTARHGTVADLVSGRLDARIRRHRVPRPAKAPGLGTDHHTALLLISFASASEPASTLESALMITVRRTCD
jgi:hypothetical protein